jgi:hypothetical protein
MNYAQAKTMIGVQEKLVAENPEWYASGTWANPEFKAYDKVLDGLLPVAINHCPNKVFVTVLNDGGEIIHQYEAPRD